LAVVCGVREEMVSDGRWLEGDGRDGKKKTSPNYPKATSMEKRELEAKQSLVGIGRRV
jgi:hypothetical protein